MNSLKVKDRIGKTKDGKYIAQIQVEGVNELFILGPFATREQAVEEKEKAISRMLRAATETDVFAEKSEDPK